MRKYGAPVRGVVADALERHVDEGAVVGLERDAQVELDHAVGALDRPVVAARQHLAAKPVALERAAGDRKRDARAVRPRADVLGRRACSDEGSSEGAIRMAVFLFGRGEAVGAASGHARASGERRERGELEDVSVVERPRRASEDLVDRVDGAFGAPIAARYGEEAIQERVLRDAPVSKRGVVRK